MAEVLFRMQMDDGLNKDMDWRSAEGRNNKNVMDMDFDNRPVAFMEEDESAEARDSMPGFWRDSRTPMRGLLLGESKENITQRDTTKEHSGSSFGNKVRLGECSSGGDTGKGKARVASPTSTGWMQDDIVDPTVTGLKLSEYMGAREISTPIQKFTPSQVLGEVDMMVVHSDDSSSSSVAGYVIHPQDMQEARGSLPVSIAPQGRVSKASTSRAEQGQDTPTPRLQGPEDEVSALIPIQKRSKMAARMSNPEARKRFKAAVGLVVNTNTFTKTAGFFDRRGSIMHDDFTDSPNSGFAKVAATVYKLLSPTRILQMADRGIPVVNPDARKRRYWDMMILVFVIYNAVAVPLDAGFGYSVPNWLETVEICIDIFFFIDVFYNFRTAYLDAQGNTISDGKKIAGNYLKTWFAIDLLASIPFEYVAVMLGINVSERITLLAFLKTPRLLRLGRVLRFFERMKNANVFRIVRLMATMCLIAHWIACTWHFLYNNFSQLPWIFTAFVELEDPPSSYLIAFFHSFVLLMGDNVGPQNDVEYIFCCVVLVVGACFMATVVGNMALLVSNMNVTAARHRTKMDMVSDAVRYLGMPDQIQERVQEYFDYLATFSHPGPEGMHVLSELPASLHEDICALLHVRAIRKVPPFKNCEEPFIMQLVVKLQGAVYMPGDTIFRGGDVGHEMYLISKGRVAVINKNEEVVAILNEGSYFGELALLATARRVATCTALTHCDLNVLNSVDLQMTMRDFPVSAEMVKKWALGRLSELNPAMLSDPPPRPPPLEKFSPVKPQSSAQSRAPNAGPQRQAAPEPEAKPVRVLPESVEPPCTVAHTAAGSNPLSHGNALNIHSSEAMSPGDSHRIEGLLGMLLQKIEDLEVRVNDVATSVQSIGEHSGGVLGELAKTGGLGSSGALLGDGPAAGSSSLKKGRRQTANSLMVTKSASYTGVVDSS